MKLHSCSYYCDRPKCIKVQRDEFVKRMEDADEYLFCWKVQGISDEYTGYMAEEEAKAVAKRIGGNCFAFPLYVRPQPAQEWVGLTDEEIEAIWRDVEVSDIYDCVLPLSRAIEQASKEKNYE